MEPLSYDGDIETVVGNGRLIARVRAASAEFVFAGPSSGYRLLVDGEPADSVGVRTEVLPGRTRFLLGDRGTATVSAQPDATLMVILIQATRDADWALELTGEGTDADAETRADEDEALATTRGRAALWTDDSAQTQSTQQDASTGTLHVRLADGERAAFLLGTDQACAAITDPFQAVEDWAQADRQRGLRLRTPDADLDRAVAFAKVHLRQGYDWNPDADGHPGGPGSKMVCDIFRWRDVWSRDFGSGFGPGGIAAGLIGPVLATLDYEAARYSSHPPQGLKVSDDTSQGGSAEGLGWLMKLVWLVYKHTGDEVWLARMVSAFEPWMDLWVSRDHDGLVVDVTEWMDHSRFLRLPEGQRTLYSNALYYAALRRMDYVCRALGRTADADRYRGLADHSRQSIHDAFWNESGYFNNAVQWGVADTTLMLADNAIAVIEKIAGRNERFRTLETIKERSWRTYGTVTTDLPMRYVPADNDHNQRVWPWWMAHEAKARFHNFDAEGGLHVLGKIVDTFARPTLPGMCEEYVDPDDGAQDAVVGHAFITGSGAMLDAIQYGLVGLSIRQPGEKTVRLAPATPRAWENWGADLDLVTGTLHYDETTDGLRVVLAETSVETLELRIPPREAVELVTMDGKEVEPDRQQDGASEYFRFAVTPGAEHTIEVSFAPQRVWGGNLAMPPLPPPVPVARPLLMDEPRLFADILQSFVRAAVSYFGTLRHVAAREIGDLGGDGDLVVIVGNELPYRTKQGESVPDTIDGFLGRGGSLLLLGPRFPRIDITADYHGGAQMGQDAGMFWWKTWADGRWQDFDPRADEIVPAPDHDGTVYWGDGPLFAAWEHSIGLFGFETECLGVFDVEGGVVDPDQKVEIVYTDWTVRKPWSFTPLAFTEREHQLITGPRRERYPCAALLQNAETGARIVVVSPSVCSRTDLLHRMLAHVAQAPGESAGSPSAGQRAPK